jgi:uncharacterized surface protein with fasciclin (FAS1) repeats
MQNNILRLFFIFIALPISITVTAQETTEEPIVIQISQPDLITPNGTVHIIDAVLISSDAEETLNEFVEARAEATPEATLEVTPETTPEVTPEATAEITPNPDTDDDWGNVWEVISTAPQLSTFAQIMEIIEVAEGFNDEGNFTIFTPTNEAFRVFFEIYDLTLYDLLENPSIAELVFVHHVVFDQQMNTDDFTAENEVITLSGGPLMFSIEIIEAELTPEP